MGENCESKLLHWKNEIEKVKGARLLRNEVKEKQVGVHDEEMHIDIDFSEETLKSQVLWAKHLYILPRFVCIWWQECKGLDRRRCCRSFE